MRNAIVALVFGLALVVAPTASADYEDCGNTTITGSYDLPMKAKNMSCGNAQ